MFPKRARRSFKTRLAVVVFFVLVSPSLVAYYLLFLNQQSESKTPLLLLKKSIAKGGESNRIDNSNLLDQCSMFDNHVCCAPWTSNTDKWWSQNYLWTLSHENQSHTCFEKIVDEQQIDFLVKLHQLQQQCEYRVQQSQISSGYAAALQAVARSFYASYQSGYAFQITLAHDTANWNFSPKNASHWAYCETRDMNCFYLPLSPCAAEQGRNDAPRGNKPSSGKALQEFQWLREHAFRVRHVIRQHVQLYWETQPERVQAFVKETNSKCTTIHVRRGDIAFGKGRRYAAVDEYLEAGGVQPGETVLLLTDDASAVDEVEQYLLNDQNWIYVDRPRTRGTALGFEGFIPSQDPAFEVLSILAELQLASHCQKLVHGKSGFVTVIAEAMSSPELVYLEIQLDKKQQPKMDPADRVHGYLQQIEEHYEKRNKTRKPV